MGEPVLARVTRILDAFSPDDDVLAISQLAARSGLHLATTSRLVQQMIDEGYLSRDDDRRVRLGIRLWELASRAAPTRSLREAALPFLEDLHAVVGHHVQIGVLSTNEVLFIERLSTPEAIINLARVAGRIAAHASALGLVLLAAAEHSVVEDALAAPLIRLTPHTITDPHQLRRVLADVRRQGFAVNAGHVDVRATGIAAPVRDRSGRVVAAVGVVVPNNPEARTAIGAVQTAGLGISRALSSH